MKGSSIALGILFILLGGFWLLSNLGFINLSVWSIIEGLFDLWPMIFIVLGVNIIFKGKKYVQVISWIIFFAIVITYGFFQYGTDVQFNTKSNNIVSEKLLETMIGVLDLDLGGGNITIGACDEKKLITAHNSNPYVSHRIDYENNNKKANVLFKEKNHTIINTGRQGYDYDFQLNKDMQWNIDLDMGALNGTFDLSQFRVDKLDIDMGAGKATLIFGDLSDYTDVKIGAGASDFNLVIPKDVGVQMKVDSAITSGNIKYLNWERNNNVYTSPNYKDARKKINFNIDMGVGKIDVKWE